MIKDNYIRKAQITKISDGDSFEALVDVGFGASLKIDCRLSGLNSKEAHSPEGQKAKELLEYYSANSEKIFIESEMVVKTMNMKKEKWRRYLVKLYFYTKTNPDICVCFNDILIDMNLAVPYNGTGIRD